MQFNLHSLFNIAQDYDVDIDHKLDEMRFHRSRVNYVNQVTPVNVSRTIRLRCEAMPEVFTPFDPAPVSIVPTEGGYQLTLPPRTPPTSS